MAVAAAEAERSAGDPSARGVEAPAASFGKEQALVETPLPRRQMLAICLCQFMEGVQLTLPFTVAAYMVRGFEAAATPPGQPVDEERIGRLTGVLAGTFSAAQFLTSYPIGLLSDRIGRKVVVMAGTVSCGAGIVLFGFAHSYAAALAARFVAGFFDGVWGALKSALGETCDATNQPRAMGLLSLAWGLGSILGPSIGGALARPCDNFGRRFPGCASPGSLLAAQPYLLPCLAAAAIAAVTLAAVACLFQETLPRLQGYQRVERAAQDVELAAAGASSRAAAAGTRLAQGADATASTPLSSATVDRSAEPSASTSLPRRGGGGVVRRNDTALGGFGRCSPLGGPVDIKGAALERDGAEVSALSSLDSAEALSPAALSGTTQDAGVRAGDDRAAPAASGCRPQSEAAGAASGQRAPAAGSLSRQAPAGAAAVDLLQQDGAGGSGSEDEGEGARLLGSHDGGCVPALRGAKLVLEDERAVGWRATPDVAWWRQPQAVLAVAGYVMLACVFTFLDEVTPIFASAPAAEGGLALSPSQLAGPLAFGGSMLMLFVLTGYPALQRRYGTLATLRAGLWMGAPVVLLSPTASLFAPYTGARFALSQLVFYGSQGLRTIAATAAFTSTMIITNDAAPPGQIGALNGVGQMLSGLVRALGPALGGLTWAAALQMRRVPGHQFLPFALVSVGMLGVQLLYSFVRHTPGGHQRQARKPEPAAQP